MILGLPLLLPVLTATVAWRGIVATGDVGRNRRDVDTYDGRNRRDVDSYDGPLHVYPRPVYLPIAPCYEIDIPEQPDRGKFFGAKATTVYETIIVRETVRPVCLLADGNVPSCDRVVNDNKNNGDDDHHHHQDGHRPKNPSAAIDYQSYFVEPSRPDVKIEVTEIPFRGAFMLTGAAVQQQDDEGHRVTPPLPDIRPVAEDVQERGGGGSGHRQFLQNAFGAAGSAFNSGLASAVAGAAGLVGAGGLVAAAAGGAGQTGTVTNVMGGGQKLVTVYVTRVEKVVDDRVTATLVPKNCVPKFNSHPNALRPCSANTFGYFNNAPPSPWQQQFHQNLPPPFQPNPSPPFQPNLPPPFQPNLPPSFHQHPPKPAQLDVPQPSQPRPPQQTAQQPFQYGAQKASMVAIDVVSRVNGLVQDFVDAQINNRVPRPHHNTQFHNGPF